MKHISQIITSKKAPVSDLRALQIKREEAQAANDVVALRALDNQIEDMVMGGVK